MPFRRVKEVLNPGVVEFRRGPYTSQITGFKAAATTENIVSGFRKADVFPFRRPTIDDEIQKMVLRAFHWPKQGLRRCNVNDS